MHADVAKRANNLLIFIIRRQERRQQQREAESVATQLVLRANRKAVELHINGACPFLILLLQRDELAFKVKTAREHE